MYIERDLKEKFDAVASSYGMVAVVGPRQAGKTTFLKEQLAKQDTAYVTFDDPDARRLFDEDVKKFETQYLEGHGTTILDEAQYGKEAGQKLKYLVDKGRKLWVTSSSQTMLGADVLSWLVGRASILRIYQFSLNEFLRAKCQKTTDATILRRDVWEHVTYGGYPKVVTTADTGMKKTLLKDLYETMVLKDVAKTFSIQDIDSLERFSGYLAHSIGHALVYDKVCSQMNLSFATVKKYADAMEKSYLIARVPPFYTNKLKEVAKQPKAYFMDTGLRNAVANNFPVTLENEGRLFENYVFTELVKNGFSVKYWQTKGGAEVDFVVEEGGKAVPVEAKLRVPSPKIERSLKSFIDSHKPERAIVAFYEGETDELEANGCRVIFTDVQNAVNEIRKATGAAAQPED